MTVTVQAPSIEPTKHTAAPVPQIDAPLLTPNSVAGWVLGNTANSAGTRISPPPPTIESTKPANSEAIETSSNSIRGLSPPCAAARLPPEGDHVLGPAKPDPRRVLGSDTRSGGGWPPFPPGGPRPKSGQAGSSACTGFRHALRCMGRASL